ncbi:hypothetical protein FEM41_22940 [Jejubacter calystegiae]|uniref:Uncharacterized protein n=1 Tax=Jejubacter calystegiae TaxID=2579935 RepID=A0A4P8YPU0_9ENTR|nr:hypothetical protein FEM41_22940 [Jejubacter calystegiae]
MTPVPGVILQYAICAPTLAIFILIPYCQSFISHQYIDMRFPYFTLDSNRVCWWGSQISYS